MDSVPTLLLLGSLIVAPEHRCAEYDRADYPYPQAIELQIIEGMGGLIYGPYTGRYFEDRRETDIEHIISLSEAHDSGLCAADAKTKAAFASDLFNLTLAAPDVNRCGPGGKCGKDTGEWLPDKNACWFASRIVKIRSAYSLAVDQAEASALAAVIEGCASFRMIF